MNDVVGQAKQFLRGLAESMDDTATVWVRNAASGHARAALLHGDDPWTVDGGRPFTRRSLFATVHAAGLVVTALYVAGVVAS